MTDIIEQLKIVRRRISRLDGFGEECEALGEAIRRLQMVMNEKFGAKVITREEAAALPEGAVCWLEERYEKSNLSYIQPMMSNGEGMLIGTHLTASPARMSTRGRRFWSAKPTREQREGTAWK